LADALRPPGPPRTREGARDRCGLGGSAARWTGGGRTERGVGGPFAAVSAVGLVGRLLLAIAFGPSRRTGARGAREAAPSWSSAASPSCASSLSDEDEMTDAFRLSSASVGRAAGAGSASASTVGRGAAPSSAMESEMKRLIASPCIQLSE
jgi:hypothetical protein